MLAASGGKTHGFLMANGNHRHQVLTVIITGYVSEMMRHGLLYDLGHKIIDLPCMQAIRLTKDLLRRLRLDLARPGLEPAE